MTTAPVTDESSDPLADQVTGEPVAPAADDVRWLDVDQQRHWRAFLVATQMLNDVLDRQLGDESGLSLAEYEVLVRLSEAPGRTLRMSELAAGLAHSRSRLSHAVGRMERSGLVARSRCASDARGVLCTMTDHGWRAIEGAAPGHVRAVRAHLVDVLTDAQLAALGEAMTAVYDHLSAREA
ncbi:MarR family winged helix-turn-helix transcriptional regulator [Cellulomonas citrea]|uniref:MarR family winged helix-turn-helix transcriptional regulator n=1 Tax=Cellulomonas citrea TaxID=1909423 RepID=UPI001359EB61|nr:MarR family winged helix-turn-helix transcriptional regulator [Cellulomonas citrea]